MFSSFHSIFKVIDNLEIEETDKKCTQIILWQRNRRYFRKTEADRYEKHEKATQWIDRLVKSQFNIPKDVLKLPLESHLGVKMKYHLEGFFGFTYEDETVLAVIYAN
ncbi:MAG: hypothetical protein IPM92_08020 [Saprospiraceae bacterium]|nr:hypothetical protein [Saprospiraceae bacterium]